METTRSALYNVVLSRDQVSQIKRLRCVESNNTVTFSDINQYRIIQMRRLELQLKLRKGAVVEKNDMNRICMSYIAIESTKYT